MGQRAITLVKASNFSRDLRDVAGRSSIRMHIQPIGLGNVHKYLGYGLGNEPYLLIVSQKKDKVLSSEGHNLSFSVTSYANAQNREIADQFSRETGVPFNVKPADRLVSLLTNLDVIFPLFLRSPETVLTQWGVKTRN